MNSIERNTKKLIDKCAVEAFGSRMDVHDEQVLLFSIGYISKRELYNSPLNNFILYI